MPEPVTLRVMAASEANASEPSRISPAIGKSTVLLPARVMPRSMAAPMLAPVYRSVAIGWLGTVVPVVPSTMPAAPGVAYAPRWLATPAF